MSDEALMAADVRVVWDTILPGLQAVKAKTRASWRVEDVYHSLVAGSAFLYVGDPGFVIVESQVEPFSGEPVLLVWIAFSRARDGVARFQAAVDALARAYGYSRLRFWSNRAGWEQAAGWDEVAQVYERAVS